MQSRGVSGPSSLLVAEDDELLAASLVQHLHRLGCRVIGPAFDGQQALNLAQQQRPDMALLDIRLPLVTGLGAAAVLYKQWGVPVVLLSAHAQDEYVHAGQRIGVFGYMLKPVTPDALRVGLAIAWSRYQEAHQLQDRLEEMKQALEDRKFIERAKGMLMDRLGLSENDAMRRLQKQARDSRRKLPDIARSIVETEEILTEP